VNAVRLHPRTAGALLLASLVGLVAFGWPLLAQPGSGLAHSGDAPLLFAALLPLLLAVVLAELAEGGIDSKAIAMLGVLAAVGAALRPLGGGVTGFSPVFLLVVLAGRALGRGFGFVLGAVTLFASALLTGGIGPWLPFQMLGAAWVGFLAGCLPSASGRAEVVLVAAYGAAAGLAYGMLLDLWFWPFTTGLSTTLSFVAGDPLSENLHRFFAFWLATSLGFDIPRAIGNLVLVLAVGGPVLRALRRSARRAAFEVPVEFVPAAR
jgi:energy-coupling factor transport system substrate-specific component